jgi:hypothetical protein
MPLLLLLPLLVAGIFALWVVLLPFALVQRYRHGRARRRAQGWVVRANAWLLAISALLLLLGAWVGSRWMAHGVRDAAVGLLAGIALGIAGVWSSRFESTPKGLYYTPNRWLVMALTSLLALRILLGLWLAWQSMRTAANPAWSAWFDHGGLLAVAAVLLGYYLAYTWGLRRRLS